jgi:predicted dehydrogenase
LRHAVVEFASGERLAGLAALTSIVVPKRPTGSAHSFTAGVAPADLAPALASVTTEVVAVVAFRTAAGVPGGVVVSQVAAGRRSRLWFELDGSAGSAVFDQEAPETAWLGSPDGAQVIARGAGRFSADQERVSYLPGGHPRGYQDCFNAFIADVYAAMAGKAPDGLPTLADGLRVVRITDAVLASGASGAWIDIEGIPR